MLLSFFLSALRLAAVHSCSRAVNWASTSSLSVGATMSFRWLVFVLLAPSEPEFRSDLSLSCPELALPMGELRFSDVLVDRVNKTLAVIRIPTMLRMPTTTTILMPNTQGQVLLLVPPPERA